MNSQNNDEKIDSDVIFEFDKFVVANEAEVKNRNEEQTKLSIDEANWNQRDRDLRYRESWQNRTRVSK